MRIILHSDINNCYASIESVAHPEYRKIPIAVGGEEELRHGIILAKNEIAKKFVVKTGDALWQAKSKCPDIKILPPNYPLYTKYCNLARQLYLGYTDLTEPFGPDESWLDVTGSTGLFGSGEAIAGQIRARMKKELGLSVSIGVSFNKVFAKFGSDYKKPDAVTVITPENFKDIVWPAPASDLLFAGRRTGEKLRRSGIYTIGDIARAGERHMYNALGKAGQTLYFYAAGLDNTPVMRFDEKEEIKTIGNSTTPPRDIENPGDAKIIMYILAENVARRMRKYGYLCTGVQIHVRDPSLMSYERQKKLEYPACLADEICAAGMELLCDSCNWERPLRSIGVRAINLIPDEGTIQYSMFRNEEKFRKKEIAEITADKIRSRYGKLSICRAVILSDPVLGEANKPRLAPDVFRTH